jgi:Transposase DDE domain
VFIKVTTSGGRRYAQLVESFRNEAGQPRQRTLATLGRLEPDGDVDRLIQALQRAQGREEVSSSTGAPIRDLQFLESRSVGDVWALWQLWRSLDLEALSLAWRSSHCEVDVLACLRAMVFNRLCEPASKLGVLRWLETVGLPRGFGFEEAPPEHHQLLRAMDVLDEHAEAIADRLALLMRPLIDQELSVVFYDLTTVRIHGEHRLHDDVREFGPSKEGGVARQFMLSLVQTAEGLPIAHEVHPGNTAEAATLLPMIKKLLARWPLKRVVLVADRGLLNLNNLRELDALRAELAASGRAVSLEYVLAVPAARYGEFKDELLALHEANADGQGNGGSKPWVAEMIWEHGAKMPPPSGDDDNDNDNDNDAAGTKKRRRRKAKPGPEPEPVRYRLVVAHDPQAAQRRTQARRAEIQALVALGEQWGGKLDAQEAKDGSKRQRGRPLSDSGAKARLYHAVRDASLAHLIKVDLKSELFQFTIDEARQQYLERLDGKLVLVTNADAPAAEVVQRYKSLADIERGFRALKSEIEIGPIYHRLPRRVRAHALVCFLALILHRVLRMRLKAGNRAESPATLLDQLRRVQGQTARTADGHELRGLTELGSLQKDLFAALGVALPNPAEIVTTSTQDATAGL